MRKEEETYLGDGLYASFDGWQIKLRAPRPHGIWEERNEEVFLEPAVWAALKPLCTGCV
jgi:hypothetical protein